MSRPTDLVRACRNAIGSLVEDHNADAVLIVVTRQRKRGTETLAIPFGNLHTVRGIAEYAYGRLCEDPSEEEDDERTTGE
jgi:hypothetical protein